MTRRPSWLMVLMTVAVIVGACSSGGTATTAPTAATSAEAIATALAAWRGAVDEIVLRAIVAQDTADDHLTLLRAC